jgi:hypothetical protein
MNSFKKVLLITLILSMTIAPLCVLASTYVANSRTGIFHYQGCEWEQKMWEQNRVYYNDRQECIADGYRPCKVCRP